MLLTLPPPPPQAAGLPQIPPPEHFLQGARRKSFGQLGPPDPCFTFEEWADLPHRGCSFSVVLAQGQLHVEQRHPGDDKEQCVRDQKGTWRTQRQRVTPPEPCPALACPSERLDQHLVEPWGPHPAAPWPLPEGGFVVDEQSDAETRAQTATLVIIVGVPRLAIGHANGVPWSGQ